MRVPVVAASRLKRDVKDRQVGVHAAYRIEPRASAELLCKPVIWAPHSEETAMPGFISRGLVVDLLRERESRPRIGPSRVKGDVRQDFRHLGLGDPVCFTVIVPSFGTGNRYFWPSTSGTKWRYRSRSSGVRW